MSTPIGSSALAIRLTISQDASREQAYQRNAEETEADASGGLGPFRNDLLLARCWISVDERERDEQKGEAECSSDRSSA